MFQVECCIAYCYSVRKLQHCHHCGEALYDKGLQKPECKRVLSPKVEYHIAHSHSVRGPQPCHHFGEAPCNLHLQSSLLSKVHLDQRLGPKAADVFDVQLGSDRCAHIEKMVPKNLWFIQVFPSFSQCCQS